MNRIIVEYQGQLWEWHDLGENTTCYNNHRCHQTDFCKHFAAGKGRGALCNLLSNIGREEDDQHRIQQGYFERIL